MSVHVCGLLPLMLLKRSNGFLQGPSHISLLNFGARGQYVLLLLLLQGLLLVGRHGRRVQLLLLAAMPCAQAAQPARPCTLV